jgi:nucleoside-diphosphate-sugar epimerase
VTGSTGFLGAEVVRQLRGSPCRLRTTGRRAMPLHALPDYHPLDLCNASGVARLMDGVDVVIHAAGLAHRSHETASCRDEFYRTNSNCTETVTRAAVAAGCRRLVLVSSVAVYGGGGATVTESHPCRPTSDYARSKYQGEQTASEIAAAGRLELTILRMATIYGAGDPGNVGRLMRAIERRRFIWVGKGQNRKSLVHVEDAARACATAALADELPRDGVFNVSAMPVTMADIVATIASALGRSAPALRLPSAPLLQLADCGRMVPGLRGTSVRVRRLIEKWTSDEVYDGSLFRESFGWTPHVTLSEGLARQVAGNRQRHAA